MCLLKGHCKYSLSSRHCAMQRGLKYELSCILPCSREGLVVPHEKLGVFLEDVLGNLPGHGDDGGVVAVGPGALEAGTDGLEAEELEPAGGGGAVVGEFAEERALAELLKILCLVRGLSDAELFTAGLYTWTGKLTPGTRSRGPARHQSARRRGQSDERSPGDCQTSHQG